MSSPDEFLVFLATRSFYAIDAFLLSRGQMARSLEYKKTIGLLILSTVCRVPRSV